MASVRHLGLFPWCIGKAEQNDLYSFYPQSVDLRTALKWYWRVKSWRFVASASANNKTESHDVVILNNAIYENGTYIVTEPESEKELVCPHGTHAIYNQFSDDEFGFYIYDEIADPRIIEVDDQLFPSVIAYIDVDGIRFSSSSSNSSAAIAGTGTIDEFSFPLTIGEESAPPEGYSASITISVQEYWPYDPGDGLGPIYDIDTGKMRRSFPD